LNASFLIKLAPSYSYRYRRDYWRLKLNTDKKIQNALVEALIITNCCGFSSLVKPGTLKRKLCRRANVDSWLMKRSESDIEMFGVTSYTVDGFSSSGLTSCSIDETTEDDSCLLPTFVYNRYRRLFPRG
jgi:hypothetical protein